MERMLLTLNHGSRVMAERDEQDLWGREYSEEELRAIYDKIRREFTAADLQKYTEIEEGIPVEQVLEELEAMQREFDQGKGKP
jgi:hypothetical protein